LADYTFAEYDANTRMNQLRKTLALEVVGGSLGTGDYSMQDTHHHTGVAQMKALHSLQKQMEFEVEPCMMECCAAEMLQQQMGEDPLAAAEYFDLTGLKEPAVAEVAEVSGDLTDRHGEEVDQGLCNLRSRLQHNGGEGLELLRTENQLQLVVAAMKHHSILETAADTSIPDLAVDGNPQEQTAAVVAVAELEVWV
jgi:hypothetical protein